MVTNEKNINIEIEKSQKLIDSISIEIKEKLKQKF